MEEQDPIDVIKSEMEVRGLRNVDMYEVFGGKTRTSEILRRKRPLLLQHVRRLWVYFGIEPSYLIAEYPLDVTKKEA